jgi:uroporphyrinogen decarboxylase
VLSQDRSNTLSSRDRVALAIQHQGTDRLPKGEICIDETVIKTSLACGKVGFDEKLEFVNQLELDIICLNPVYPKFNGGLPDSREVVWADLDHWVDTNLFRFAMLDGILGWGIKIFGFSQFLILPNKSPLAFHSFTEKVESLNVEMARRLIDAGIDGLIIADDLACQRGLLINPQVIRTHIFPSLKSQAAEITRHSVPVFIHSDGNINEIIPDIIEMGFNGLHCIDQNSSMDILDLQLKYGSKLCFWGSLSAEDLIKAHEPVYMQGLLDTICAAVTKKGFILGTNCGLFNGISWDGLVLVYEKIRKWELSSA